MSENSKALSLPLSNSKLISNPGINNQEVDYAAWQTAEHGVPKRVVIRLDGTIQNPSAFGGTAQSFGFPCAVHEIKYSIGAFTKDVLIEGVGQNSLVVWATEVQVAAKWDRARIAALAAMPNVAQQWKPTHTQILAAAISCCECGDTGATEARRLDIVGPPVATLGGGATVHQFEIPAGARTVRALLASKNTGNAVADRIEWFSATIAAYFSANPYHGGDVTGLIEMVPNALVSPLGRFIVPADARFLILTLPFGVWADTTATSPFFLEWFIGPKADVAQS